MSARKEIQVWCSNDYMGMSWHPQVRKAVKYVFRECKYFKNSIGLAGLIWSRLCSNLNCFLITRQNLSTEPMQRLMST